MNVVWFKRDLRLTDHAPLAAAIARHEPLLLVYIVEPSLIKNPHYRGRHWHFIAQSLQAMNTELAGGGAEIQILEGHAYRAADNSMELPLGREPLPDWLN